MKKSLVIMTVLVALVAFSASVMAADKGCPPAPMKCEYTAPVKPMPGPKPVYPVPTKPKPGKCVTVPCPPIQVFQPGPPFAMAEIPVAVKTLVETDVLRMLCAGKAKGVCPVGCGPCAPTVKWACEWSTMEQCGKVKYPVVKTEMKKVPIAVKQKMVPIKPTCAL